MAAPRRSVTKHSASMWSAIEKNHARAFSLRSPSGRPMTDDNHGPALSYDGRGCRACVR